MHKNLPEFQAPGQAVSLRIWDTFEPRGKTEIPDPESWLFTHHARFVITAQSTRYPLFTLIPCFTGGASFAAKEPDREAHGARAVHVPSGDRTAADMTESKAVIGLE